MSENRQERRVAQRYKMPEDQQHRDGRIASGYHGGGRNIRKAEIYDVSHAGVSFRISDLFAPQIGEVVAVEFKIPQAGRTVAWYAQVVRVELEHIDLGEHGHSPMLRVGTQFLNLPQFQKKQLEKMIDGLLEEVHKNQRQRVSIFSEALKVSRPQEYTHWKYWKLLLLLGVSTLMAYSFVTWMSSIGSRDLRSKNSSIWNQKKDFFLEQSQGSPLRNTASESSGADESVSILPKSGSSEK